MKTVIEIAVVLMLSGCGSGLDTRALRTGKNVVLNDIPEPYAKVIRDAIDDLGDLVDRTVIVEPGGNILDSKAGEACIGCNICHMNVVYGNPAEVVKSIVWHEYGHCVGLKHVSEEQGEVMSPKAISFWAYDDDAIARFKSDVRDSL